MSRTARQFISLFLAIIFVILSVPFANAAEPEITATTPTTIFETQDTRIDYYEDEDGTFYLLQYVNNVLDQININRADAPDIIECHCFDTNGNLEQIITIDPYDYITVSHTNVVQPYGLGYYSLYGMIGYRATIDTGNINYRQVLYLKTEPEYQTEYTTNAYLGPLLTLANLIILVVEVPLAIIQAFLNSMVGQAIITVSQGKVVEELSMTLAAVCTEYSWKIYDEDITSSNIHYYSGAKYVINSQTDDGKYYGNIYHEGITPIHWGTSTMSTIFHNLTYGYTAWTVTSWNAYA